MAEYRKISEKTKTGWGWINTQTGKPSHETEDAELLLKTKRSAKACVFLCERVARVRVTVIVEEVTK